MDSIWIIYGESMENLWIGSAANPPLGSKDGIMEGFVSKLMGSAANQMRNKKRLGFFQIIHSPELTSSPLGNDFPKIHHDSQ